jgi:branched-chain amino acid transport system ATP-binding protein
VLLAVEDLVVRYGDAPVLHGVSLSVGAGEVVALLGANGAGKTTTLRAVSGLVRTVGRAGAARRRVVSGERPPTIVAAGVGHVPEGRRVFARMTVRENLEMGAYAREGPGADDLDRVHELFPVLAERSGQAAGTLSGGEQQMLAVGRALMGRPRLLLLDEPSMGLAPQVVEQLFAVIGRCTRTVRRCCWSSRTSSSRSASPGAGSSCRPAGWCSRDGGELRGAEALTPPTSAERLSRAATGPAASAAGPRPAPAACRRPAPP